MTLVGPKEESVLPIMLSVQQHHHHHGLHGSASTAQTHRGNVIVSTNNIPSADVKNLQQHGCKRSKIYGQSMGPYGAVPHQPASVARRNARERNRVKQVNNGFATLRQHIPQSVAQALGGSTAGTHGGSRAGSKKLSKVETLRMAVEYIRSLQRLLEEHDGSSDGVSSTSSSSSSGSSSTCSNGIATESSHLAAELRLRGSSEIRQHSGSHSSDLHRHQQLRQNPSPTFTPCSEASSSPTPSFVSETSSAGSQGYATSSGTVYAAHSDNYDNYEPMSPVDEDLLVDVISWWQQSQ